MKSPAIRVNAYRVLDEAVERGVAAGFRHYFKHREPLDGLDSIEGSLADKIREDVMTEVCEYFDFPALGPDDVE